MKQYWKKFAALVDGRNTRERALLLATSVIVVYLLFDALLLEPVAARSKRLREDMRNDQADTVKLAAQLQSLARERGADPDAGAKARLAELQSHLTELQRRIDAQSAELVAPDKIAAVLEKILARNPGVQLVEMTTLARSSVPIVAPGAGAPGTGGAPAAPEAKAAGVGDRAASGGAAAGTAGGKPAEIYRHRVRMTIQGSYLGLLAYLKEIESLPVRMFWEQLAVTAGDYPTVTLRVVVYTISLDQAWLTV